MKTAARIMYTIGLIFSWIALLLLGVSVVLSGLLVGGVVQAQEELPYPPTTLLVISIVFLVIYILVIVLGTRARRAIGNNQVNIAPHILCLVMGAVSGDLFYFLGGIFGLVAESYGKH